MATVRPFIGIVIGMFFVVGFVLVSIGSNSLFLTGFSIEMMFLTILGIAIIIFIVIFIIFYDANLPRSLIYPDYQNRGQFTQVSVMIVGVFLAWIGIFTLLPIWEVTSNFQLGVSQFQFSIGVILTIIGVAITISVFIFIIFTIPNLPRPVTRSITDECYLVEAEREAIMRLESLIGKFLSKVDTIDWNVVGCDVADDHVIGLSLYQCGLAEVPAIIQAFTFLESLYVVDNAISEIPQWLGKFPRLTRLSLNCNHLERVHDYIGAMKELLILDLQKNRITSLPGAIGDLKSLEELYLNDNQLQNIPDSMTNLEKLKKLDMSWNALSYLPDFIGNLESLEWLDVANNKLITLPRSLDDLLLRGLHINH